MKSTPRRVTLKRGSGYLGTLSPERDDHVKMLFKSRGEYEQFILGEAERIRFEEDTTSGSVEAAD